MQSSPTRYANRATHPPLQNGESGRRQTGHRPGTHVGDHVHKAQAKTQKSGLWCCDMASCHHIEVTTSLLREHEVRRHRRWSRRLELNSKRGRETCATYEYIDPTADISARHLRRQCESSLFANCANGVANPSHMRP